MPFIGAYIDTLYHQIKNEEALFRLDELKGLYSIYYIPLKIENFRIHPSIEQISVYEKISDFLEEAEMIKLSKEKYFLGIPSKAKIIYKKLRSSIPKYANEHKKYLQLSMELIKYSQKVVIPENIEHILKNGFSNKEFLNYNPPLVDLDYYRVQTCKQIFPSSFPNFIFSDGATRGMTDQYFLEYYLGERE